jgi:hypothetical protein
VVRVPPTIAVGDRVKVFLDSKFWESAGWFEGTVVRIDPYSKHRSFYWVELDVDLVDAQGGTTGILSILNPRNIQKI